MNNNSNQKILRPMMKVSEMVPYLKNKNIKFNLLSEEEAEKYLKENNNYYNVTAYKNNFPIYQCGELTGKYIDLDFAYLKDLSIIDYRTRIVLFKMIIDIEHYLKIRILNRIEELNDEDGYNIVNLYLEQDYNDDKYPKRIHDSIRKKVTNEYYKKIFSKYDIDGDTKIENIPIWEFLEIITFGELINFFVFFTQKYNLDDKKYIFILREINKLRNAVAHNSCVLSELDKKDNHHSTNTLITEDLKEIDLKKDSDLFLFLTKMQDEVHRYTISYHKQIRSKGALSSILDNIPGIGEVRKKKILKKYKTISSIKDASISELEEILPHDVAKNFYDYIRKEDV